MTRCGLQHGVLPAAGAGSGGPPRRGWRLARLPRRGVRPGFAGMREGVGSVELSLHVRLRLSWHTVGSGRTAKPCACMQRAKASAACTMRGLGFPPPAAAGPARQAAPPRPPHGGALPAVRAARPPRHRAQGVPAQGAGGSHALGARGQTAERGPYGSSRGVTRPASRDDPMRATPCPSRWGTWPSPWARLHPKFTGRQPTAGRRGCAPRAPAVQRGMARLPGSPPPPACARTRGGPAVPAGRRPCAG